jgi:hypothetical protein
MKIAIADICAAIGWAALYHQLSWRPVTFRST